MVPGAGHCTSEGALLAASGASASSVTERESKNATKQYAGLMASRHRGEIAALRALRAGSGRA